MMDFGLHDHSPVSAYIYIYIYIYIDAYRYVSMHTDDSDSTYIYTYIYIYIYIFLIVDSLVTYTYHCLYNAVVFLDLVWLKRTLVFGYFLIALLHGSES